MSPESRGRQTHEGANGANTTGILPNENSRAGRMAFHWPNTELHDIKYKHYLEQKYSNRKRQRCDLIDPN